MTVDRGAVLRVHLPPDGWKGALPVDVARLLEDAASHINRELRNPIVGTIIVRSAPLTDRTSRALIQYSKSVSYAVQLTATERHWCQYAYQFAHEFCHLVIDPYRCEGDVTQWFEEVVCELASVFVLRRMAERWRSHPPYPNWHPILPHWLITRDRGWTGRSTLCHLM